MSDTSKNDSELISLPKRTVKGRTKTLGFIIIQALISVGSSFFGLIGDQIDISYPHFNRRIYNPANSLYWATQATNLGITSAIIIGIKRTSKYERIIRIFVLIGSLLLSVVAFFFMKILGAENFRVTSSGPFCNGCFYGVYGEKSSKNQK